MLWIEHEPLQINGPLITSTLGIVVVVLPPLVDTEKSTIKNRNVFSNTN